MGLPKKVYRDKVRQRLTKVQALLKDKDRVGEMLKRILGEEWNKPSPHGPTAFPEQVDAIYLLLWKDLPEILDSIDEYNKERHG